MSWHCIDHVPPTLLSYSHFSLIFLLKQSASFLLTSLPLTLALFTCSIDISHWKHFFFILSRSRSLRALAAISWSSVVLGESCPHRQTDSLKTQENGKSQSGKTHQHSQMEIRYMMYGWWCWFLSVWAYVCLRLLSSLSVSWIWVPQTLWTKKNGYTVKNEISLWCCTGRKPVLNSSITLTSAVSTAVSRMNGSTLDHVLVVDRKITIKIKKTGEFWSWRSVMCQCFMESNKL